MTEEPVSQQGSSRPSVAHRTPDASRAGQLRLGPALVVNRLGYGAMRITGSGIWGEPPDTELAKRVLRRAVELGVNLIDTADSYGPDVSEQLIAEALHPYPAGLVIATKGGLVRPGPNIWKLDGRPEHLRQALEDSLRRLRLERIDLYHFHWPDHSVPFEESVGALVQLQKAGKIREIGLSNVTLAQLQSAQRTTRIVSVQNRFNLGDRSSEEVLRACEQQGIAFLPWAPIIGSEENDALQRIARKYGMSPYQVALAWLLKTSPVMLPIPGTGSVEHLEENIAAVDLRLSDDDVRALEGRS